MVSIVGKTLRCQVKLQNFLHKYAVAVFKKRKVDGNFINGNSGKFVKTVKEWTHEIKFKFTIVIQIYLSQSTFRQIERCFKAIILLRFEVKKGIKKS